MKFTVGHDKMGQQHIFKHHAFDHSLNLAYFKDRSKHKDKKNQLDKVQERKSKTILRGKTLSPLPPSKVKRRLPHPPDLLAGLYLQGVPKKMY